jgi:CDP-diacylglycerol---glycerol-3-phosphate 3-phosphatidyltransferase
MSQPAAPATPVKRSALMNVPNQVTISRVALTVVLFILLSFSFYLASLIVFMIAAGTDWVDGYWARKYGQVTQLGRILDPFADKLIVCGTFIYLAAAPQLADGRPASGVAAWMAVVIMGRELIVTALRSFIENRGGDFSAKWAGKWKMAAQCAAACFAIAQLMYYDPDTQSLASSLPAWISTGLTVTLWLAVVLTIYSGVDYIWAAWRVIRDAD